MPGSCRKRRSQPAGAPFRRFATRWLPRSGRLGPGDANRTHCACGGGHCSVRQARGQSGRAVGGGSASASRASVRASADPLRRLTGADSRGDRVCECDAYLGTGPGVRHCLLHGGRTGRSSQTHRTLAPQTRRPGARRAPCRSWNCWCRLLAKSSWSGSSRATPRHFRACRSAPSRHGASSPPHWKAGPFATGSASNYPPNRTGSGVSRNGSSNPD